MTFQSEFQLIRALLSCMYLRTVIMPIKFNDLVNHENAAETFKREKRDFTVGILIPIV